jgi:hypothetical protein
LHLAQVMALARAGGRTGVDAVRRVPGKPKPALWRRAARVGAVAAAGAVVVAPALRGRRSREGR